MRTQRDIEEVIVFVFCLLLGSSVAAAQNRNSENNGTEDFRMLENWQNLKKTSELAMSLFRLIVSPRVLRASENMNLSSECTKDIKHFMSGLNDLQFWALKLIDASAKSVDGILFGTLSSFGSYEECLNTIAVGPISNPQEHANFRGQYCVIDVMIPSYSQIKFLKDNNIIPALVNLIQDHDMDEILRESNDYEPKLRLGVCVPSGCTTEDVSKMAKSVASYLSLKAVAKHCKIKEETETSPVPLFISCFYGVAISLMVIGSTMDVYSSYVRKCRGKFAQIWLSFSLIKNFKKFVRTDNSSNVFRCLHGLRFLTLSWEILGHTYASLYHGNCYDGTRRFLTMKEEIAFQFIANSILSVDTFFFISGMLFCYWCVKLVKMEGNPFSIKIYIFHRLWRILPLYIPVIVFSFLNGIGSGPNFETIDTVLIGMCPNTWWLNVLFINNFFGSPCLPHSWYIASDLQLYLIALLILLLLLRSPRFGIALTLLGILASVLYCGISTYLNEFPPTLLVPTVMTFQEQLRYLNSFYNRPFAHAGPYFIGMLVGYLLITKPNLKISPALQAIGWPTTFLICFYVVFGTLPWNQGIKPTVLESVLFASLSKVAWTLGIAWMVVCCTTGHGGIINYILSLEMFIPLSRLCYAVYLVEPIVSLYVLSQITTTLHFQHLFTIWMFLGNICVSYAVGFVASMLFEAPILSLEKIFIPRNRRESEEEKKNCEINVKKLE